jgi:hypothetical protein
LAKATDWVWVAPGAKVFVWVEDPPQAAASMAAPATTAASAPARHRRGEPVRPRGPALPSFMSRLLS